MIKLNLGCGRDKRKGYINIDIDSRLKPDLIHDLTQPLPFAEKSVSEINLQDMLEHLTLETAVQLIKECHRVLIPNGMLVIRVPNVIQIIKKYKHQPDLMMLFLYGDTTSSGIWGAHKYGYTPKILQNIVDKIGFQIQTIIKEDTNYIFKLIKIKKLSPAIIIHGSGWRPHVEKIKKISGSNMIIATDFFSYITSIFYQGKKIWCLSNPPQPLIGKILLRPISKYIDVIFVKDHQSANYAKNIFRFSHLRIVEN